MLLQTPLWHKNVLCIVKNDHSAILSNSVKTYMLYIDEEQSSSRTDNQSTTTVVHILLISRNDMIALCERQAKIK